MTTISFSIQTITRTRKKRKRKSVRNINNMHREITTQSLNRWVLYTTSRYSRTWCSLTMRRWRSTMNSRSQKDRRQDWPRASLTDCRLQSIKSRWKNRLAKLAAKSIISPRETQLKRLAQFAFLNMKTETALWACRASMPFTRSVSQSGYFRMRRVLCANLICLRRRRIWPWTSESNMRPRPVFFKDIVLLFILKYRELNW